MVSGSKKKKAGAICEKPDPGWESERLIEALSAKNCIVRVAAAESLGSKGDKSAIKPLFELLRDEDDSVRWRAAESLEVLLDGSNVDLIRSGMRDENGWVRFWSTYLAGTCELAGDMVPELIAALEDENQEVRAIAAQSLELVGDDRAIEPLLDAMRDDWRGARINIFGALRKLIAANGESVDPDIFLNRLDDEYPDVRFVSAFFLGELGDLRALEPLLEMMDNLEEDANVRQWAAFALSRMSDDRAFNRLMDAVSNERNLLVRRMALRSLGEMTIMHPTYLDQAEPMIRSVISEDDLILVGLAQDALLNIRKANE